MLDAAAALARQGKTVPDITYPVELTPPDIEPYRAGNTGIDYVTTLTGPEPGRTSSSAR
jgi:hypothetical protein